MTKAYDPAEGGAEMSFKEIGDATGYHPATISKWVR